MCWHTWVVCTVEILPVCVSHRLRLPSVSPMMTKWPHAAMAVATPSEELDMSPHDGRLGFVSVTCSRPDASTQEILRGQFSHAARTALCSASIVASCRRRHNILQMQAVNCGGFSGC